MKSRLTSALCLVFVGVFISITACSALDEIKNPEAKIESEISFYQIDRDRILDELKSESLGGFIPQNETAYEASPTLGPPVNWTEDNFIDLANLLHFLTWNETTEAWRLRKINYDYDCQALELGPQYASLSYFKVVKGNLFDQRYESELIVEPRRNTVSARTAVYAPARSKWRMLDTSQPLMKIEEIVEIAEQQGGTDLRAKIGDDCNVQIWLFPDSPKYSEWQVHYVPKGTGAPYAEVLIGLDGVLSSFVVADKVDE